MLEKEPNIDKETLRKKVQPYIAKLGTEIDIEVKKKKKSVRLQF